MLDELWARGVLPDYREPDGIRIGPAPLSTSFAEVHRGPRRAARGAGDVRADGLPNRTIGYGSDMTAYGFHASHEQVHPSALLAAVQRAEQAGFDAAMSSDHFSPWSARQGQSAFAWSWLGAALQATSLPFGVVNAPGQRYHPAIIAQAIGTLAAMYPGRFWAALGTGEASNEHITGDRLAAQAGAQRPAARVRRHHPGAAARRGGQPRRAGPRRPGPAVDAAPRNRHR